MELVRRARICDSGAHERHPRRVSGAEAVPVIGRLPGQNRMCVLPGNAGEYLRVGHQRHLH